MYKSFTVLFAILTIYGKDTASRMHHRQKRHHCNSSEEAEISRCMEPILSYARTLQSEVLQPTEGFKVFQTMCHLHSDFHGCVADVKCKSTQLEAVESSYGYMCGYAFDVFAQHTGCFVQVEMAPEYKMCKADIACALGKFHAASSDATSRDHFCSIMRNYLDCSKQVVLNLCGQNVWKLIAKVVEQSLKVSLPLCEVDLET